MQSDMELRAGPAVLPGMLGNATANWVALDISRGSDEMALIKRTGKKAPLKEIAAYPQGFVCTEGVASVGFPNCPSETLPGPRDTR